MADDKPNDHYRDVKQLFSDWWSWRLCDSPEFATSIGIHDHDDKLDRRSPEDYENRALKLKTFINRGDVLQLTSHMLPESDRLNLRLFLNDLRVTVSGMKFEPYLTPITALDGPALDLPRAIAWAATNNSALALQRLYQIPRQLTDIRALLERGLSTKNVMPATAMKGSVEQLRGLAQPTGGLSNSCFVTPFKNTPEFNSAVAFTQKEVLPAIQTLIDFLTTDYLPVASITPNSVSKRHRSGESFYQACLEFHTSTSMTAQEIHDIGLSEVSRIEAAMLEVVKQCGGASVKEYRETHLQAATNFWQTKEEQLDDYNTLCNNINRKLGTLFGRLPKSEFEIVPIPDHEAPESTTGYYLNPSINGSRKGRFYVNQHDLPSKGKHEMEVLSLHECVPGHHLQCAIAMEMEHAPEFRKYIEDMRYSTCPGRHPLHTAYLEGWGLYCESLGKELGLYTDPTQWFGRLSFEMWRACRLVVDTGIHTKDWSLETAVTYMSENTGLSRANVENEVNRYVGWPGQACAYKIGEISLQRLRKKLTVTMKTDFNLKAFHDAVLSFGPISLQQLDDLMQEKFVPPQK